MKTPPGFQGGFLREVMDLALILLGLLILLAGLGILALGTGWSLAYDWVNQALLLVRDHAWETMTIGAFCLLVGVLLILRPRDHHEVAFVVPSHLGEVRITQDALRGIITRAALGVEGVRQVESTLQQRPEGLEITVIGELFPEVVLREISEILQTVVKKDVENYTGIRVTEVKVLVRSVEALHHARVK